MLASALWKRAVEGRRFRGLTRVRARSGVPRLVEAGPRRLDRSITLVEAVRVQASPGGALAKPRTKDCPRSRERCALRLLVVRPSLTRALCRRATRTRRGYAHSTQGARTCLTHIATWQGPAGPPRLGASITLRRPLGLLGLDPHSITLRSGLGLTGPPLPCRRSPQTRWGLGGMLRTPVVHNAGGQWGHSAHALFTPPGVNWPNVQTGGTCERVHIRVSRVGYNGGITKTRTNRGNGPRRVFGNGERNDHDDHE